jgi:hypothetical protein
LLRGISLADNGSEKSVQIVAGDEKIQGCHFNPVEPAILFYENPIGGPVKYQGVLPSSCFHLRS